MNAIDWWESVNRIGFAALRFLMAGLWQSSILIAAVGLVMWLLRSRRASVRHALLLAALLLAPILPLLSFAASRAGTPQAAVRVLPSYAPQAIRATQPLAPSGGVAGAAPSLPAGEPPRTADSSPRAFSPLGYPWALAFIGYCAGLLLVAGWISLGRIRIHQWISGATPCTDERVLRMFKDARETIKLREDLLVLESGRVPTPLSAGMFRPVVLLPQGIAVGLSDDELRAVALHETTHVRRRDPLLLGIVSVVRAVFFFHPLIWLAARQISSLAEQVADDAVLDATAEPLPYARMLTRFAENLPRRALSTEVAAGLALSRSAFLSRVRSVLSDRRDSIRKLSRLAAAATLLAGIASIALAAALPLGEKLAEVPEQSARTGEMPSAQSPRPLFPIQRAGKYGYIDGKGNIAVPLQFDGVSAAPEELGNGVIEKGKWHHVAASWNQGSASLYVDGELAGTHEFEKAAPARVPLRIGKGSTDLGRHFAGEIDELRIWNVARTEGEIKRYMQRTIAEAEPDLVACWTFDEGKGQMARDSSRNHLDARLGSSPEPDDADPKWIPVEAKLARGPSPAKPKSAPSPQEPSGDLEDLLRIPVSLEVGRPEPGKEATSVRDVLDEVALQTGLNIFLPNTVEYGWRRLAPLNAPLCFLVDVEAKLALNLFLIPYGCGYEPVAPRTIMVVNKGGKEADWIKRLTEGVASGAAQELLRLPVSLEITEPGPDGKFKTISDALDEIALQTGVNIFLPNPVMYDQYEAESNSYYVVPVAQQDAPYCFLADVEARFALDMFLAPYGCGYRRARTGRQIQDDQRRARRDRAPDRPQHIPAQHSPLRRSAAGGLGRAPFCPRGRRGKGCAEPFP